MDERLRAAQSLRRMQRELLKLNDTILHEATLIARDARALEDEVADEKEAQRAQRQFDNMIVIRGGE